MAKTVCWFGWVKRFFTSDPKTKSEKKSKKWRRVLEIFKIKQYPAIKPPGLLLNEATEERRRQALTVAMATAAAAEAAVAAANAAAEVVRLTVISGHYYRLSKQDRNLAAIKIQSAYRGHLARKALRALKGLVRLQAIIRGRAVRRRTNASLRQLMSDARRNSVLSQKRTLIAERSCNNCEKKLSLQPKKEFEEDESKLDCISLRDWDCSILSKKGMEALQLRKQEAIIRRERMMRYSFSHREGRSVQMAEEWPSSKIGNHLLYRSDGGEASNMERNETLRSTVRVNLINDEIYGQKQVKLGNHGKRQDFLEGLSSSQFPFPRRSFCHVKHNSSSDGENYMPSSPVFPTYMAITESAKAKTRSTSTPKQRVGFQESCSWLHLPFENDISLWSSYDGELVRSNQKPGFAHEIS